MDNEKLKHSRPGSTAEETNSQSGEAGLYRHPRSGEELVTIWDPLFGNAQSEAAVRVGFERVGDTPEGYIKTIVGTTEAEIAQKTVDAVLATDDRSETLKGIQARLNQLERSEKDKDDEITALRAQLEAKNEQSETKAEATAQTEARTEGLDSVGGTNPNDATLTGGSNTGVVDDKGDGEEESDEEEVVEKPLTKQNSNELAETAAKEGVEITPDLDTNKKLAAAIQAKRDAETENK